METLIQSLSWSTFIDKAMQLLESRTFPMAGDRDRPSRPTLPEAPLDGSPRTMGTWVRPTALFPNVARIAPLSDVFFLRSFRDRAHAGRFTPTLDHRDELQALTWPASAAHRLMRFVRMVEVFNQCRCWFAHPGRPAETAALIERTVPSC